LGTEPNSNFYRATFAFLPDGKTVAGLSNNYPDQNLHFWDITTGKETRQIDNDQPFNSMAISPDGTLVALGSNQRVEVWDLASGDDVKAFPGPQNIFFQALAFSADGRVLAAASSDAIRVWEMASGQERLTIRLRATPPANNFMFRGGMPSGFASLAFSADGAVLAAAGGTGGISPTGMQMASDTAIRLWNLRSGQELPPLVGHQGQVSCLVFTPDGKRLLSLDSTGTKLEWDARRISGPGPAKLRAPNESEMADLWDSLADADAFQTYRAIRLLSADPKRALAFLQTRLQPVPAGNTDQITQLIGDLQSQSGSVRRKAMAGLRKQGEAALGALSEAAKNPQAFNFNQNLGMMLNKLEMIYNTPERQRASKAVKVLEQIGTREAEELLQKLAKGAAGTRLTTAAKDALGRLKARPAADKAAIPEPKVLWDDLTGEGQKAFQAIIRLASQPDKTVPWLREQVKPIQAPDPKKIEELVAALDHSDFHTRQKAMTELDKLGEAAEPALKKALASPTPLEAKKRVQQLLSRLDQRNLSPAQLRQSRALEVLEQIGSPEARQLLQELAQGAAAARITRDARASLARLEKRGTGK
jgi:hypothetical protein